jgi:hypothetical protein
VGVMMGVGSWVGVMMGWIIQFFWVDWIIQFFWVDGVGDYVILHFVHYKVNGV